MHFVLKLEAYHVEAGKRLWHVKCPIYSLTSHATHKCCEALIFILTSKFICKGTFLVFTLLKNKEFAKQIQERKDQKNEWANRTICGLPTVFEPPSMATSLDDFEAKRGNRAELLDLSTSAWLRHHTGSCPLSARLTAMKSYPPHVESINQAQIRQSAEHNHDSSCAGLFIFTKLDEGALNDVWKLLQIRIPFVNLCRFRHSQNFNPVQIASPTWWICKSHWCLKVDANSVAAAAGRTLADSLSRLSSTNGKMFIDSPPKLKLHKLHRCASKWILSTQRIFLLIRREFQYLRTELRVEELSKGAVQDWNFRTSLGILVWKRGLF